MPRYFFDIHDGQSYQRDNEGTECAGYKEAREEAMRALPEIARFAIPGDGDNRAFTVMVCDESRAVVYTATLTFAGLDLTNASDP